MPKYKFEGLSKEEVERAAVEWGKNTLPPPKVETFLEKLIDNFKDPLIQILCVALAITVTLGVVGYADWVEGLGIGIAVFLATFVSTYSEYKNESSFQELQEKASRIQSKVFRDGALITIPITDIVVGDHVLLESGDKVPADGPLLAGNLAVNQASLTGEPEPIKKSMAKKDYRPPVRHCDDEYLVFRGSLVEEGDGVMLVSHVGTETLFGRLIKELDEAEDRASPLEVKLKNLAEGISNLGYMGATFIFFSFLFKQFVMDQGYSYDNIWLHLNNWQLALHDTVTALILSIIIIVVAVPEGLPMMIAIVLSINMKRLLDEQVLVRKLLGIETAGSLDILFTDKTGTITVGRLEPHVFVSGDAQHYALHPQEKIPASLRSNLYFAIKHSSACHINAEGEIVGGNSSDKAFFTVLEKEYAMKEEHLERNEEILFSSSLKFSGTSVVVKDPKIIKALPKDLLSQKAAVSLIKGAPEKLLPLCDQYFTKDGVLEKLMDQDKLATEVDNLSHSGIRVVAIATSFEQLDTDSKQLPKNLNLIGLIGLRDEIRKESKEAIQLAKKAGIQVVMITGDRKETAISIAREVGLLPTTNIPEDEGSDVHLPRNSVLTSDEIHQMGDDELLAIIPEVSVIARALPTDKSRLVTICQKLNRVIGMTGDGVNDVAALSLADVGFAMGSGTEMAKEAADIVIMDDNFNSITKAILYGRTIFRSIRKFIIFQSTINVASTLIVFTGPFLGIDFPLTLIQLLWVNIVMDTLAALAFGGEPALTRYMHEKPVRRDEAIVSPYMWSSFILGGCFIAFLSISILSSEYCASFFQRNGLPDQDVFLTAFFGFFIFITTMNAFNVRTRKLNILDGIWLNPGFLLVLVVIFVVQMSFTYIGGSVLRTVPLTVKEWVVIFSVCFVIIPFDLLRKIVIAPWLPKKLLDRSGLDAQAEEEQKKADLKEQQNLRDSKEKEEKDKKKKKVKEH
uniref:Calcium-transporting ATPase n=1 Tax=Arcella intermedia TaxID=1963864 RepID=A0A6B2KX22_9EUKA|eukprot:TRINITY_DN4061_c0_g1_i1.p1 TRINITY_DN4061_c0_g1~~TRINITY_DN4061_c0_g1_i1.p1  ORF type:complete len:965 (-),score=228.54 TRINITY_DN4061_c0_g1_i1:44-2938(-)